MSTEDTTPIAADDARAALAESRRRQDQTVAAGSATWPARLVLTTAGALVPLGYLIDVDMIWLFAVLVGLLAAFATGAAVRLRNRRRSVRWDLALAGTFLLALLADIAVQFGVRGADWPLPNTFGMAAAAVVVVAVSWPVQARGAAWARA